jgi:hypothetical protein
MISRNSEGGLFEMKWRPKNAIEALVRLALSH